MLFSNWPVLLLQRLLFRKERFTTYLWKKKYWLICDRNYLDDHSPKEVLAKNVYREAILRAARGGKISYVNVGANIGAFDVAVASLVDVIERAVCFELNPRTAARLRNNLIINRLDGIIVKEVGIGAQRATLTINETGSGHNFNLYARHQGNGDAVICHVVPFDEAMQGLPSGETGWDLLKLDCEGAEYEILSSAGERLLRQFAHIVLELHQPPPGYGEAEIFEALKRAGFVEIPLAKITPSVIRYFKRV